MREDNTLRLWRSIFGKAESYLCVFSGNRPSPEAKLDKHTVKEQYYQYPREAKEALKGILREAAQGQETYFCAHLLVERKRKKENAAWISTLYVDGEDAIVPDHLPPPSNVVESSPGRYQYYWVLSRPVKPEEGARLNKLLAYAIPGADRSGWDLTQLLRPPETLNHKYESTPTVALREISDRSYDPNELERRLSPLSEEATNQDLPAVERSPEGKHSSESGGGGGYTEIEIRHRLRQAKRSRSRGSVKFNLLYYKGEINEYKSSSEARIDLMGQLAFWFGRDIKTMVRVFKRSALWEKHRCEDRLLWHDAAKAVTNNNTTYHPDYRTNRDEREHLCLSLLSLAMELPWKGQGGPTEGAVYCALINTGRELGEMCAEGLTVYRSLRQLALDAGVSKLDTASNALDRLEKQGLIRRLGRHTVWDAERYLIMKPTHHRHIKINTLPPCVSLYVPLLCRFRNPPPETDKTHDKNGRRISRVAGPLLRSFTKLQALIVMKVLAAGPKGLTHRQLARSLERRGNSLKRQCISGLIDKDCGLLLYEGGIYKVPDDIGERLEGELERSRCPEVEDLQRERDARDRQGWDRAYEEYRYGKPPPETPEAQVAELRAQGEAERRAEAAGDEATISDTLQDEYQTCGMEAPLFELKRDGTGVPPPFSALYRAPSREELRYLYVDPDKERFYFPERYANEEVA